MTDESVVPPALSTIQGEESFDLGRFSDIKRDRYGYLGREAGSRDELLVLIKEHYMVDEIVQFLNENMEYRKITLQFPDSLVQDSALVAQMIQDQIVSCTGRNEEGYSKTVCENNLGSGCCQKIASSDLGGRQIWILADTAYSACCVDEVASEHVNGDLVIHFGDACLNAIQKLPVLYCFGKPHLNLDDITARFQQSFGDTNEKVVLMANAPYTHHLATLYEKLKSLGYQNILYSDLNLDFAGPSAFFVGRPRQTAYNVAFTLENRLLLHCGEEANVTSEDLQSDYSLFHVTQPDAPRLLFLTTKFKSLTIYEPSQDTLSQGPFPSMMRRYKFMHVARTAGTIGILVNTLSLRNTKETIRRLAKLIKDNGKKHYMFVVGKPNVAKLANFEPIDVWCILGCGQSGIILDQFNEFLKPIITPYELTMALNPEVTWTGEWVVEFKQVLKDLEEGEEAQVEDIGQQEPQADFESDAPEFNAVSGQYVSTSRPLRNVEHIDISASSEDKRGSSNELVEKFLGAVTIGSTYSTSAAHLQNRQWSGLGSDFTPENYEEEGATLEQGGSGIASQYEFDKKNKV
ncbi:LANO_0G12398g1_1 [Lachancea nothofagi CBS 11611]|uniref:2-(3-amino-3-carboxypropyl)histidine synthase subunit 2 n=1 Tax=Lachancea nothofagi CBS 11611 TaxID=1266666 RepID=A0A1G4KJV1_9SACH|nr:LANO_0G12398g1_1 [Lachancea nothofagi CBS 11611]